MLVFIYTGHVVVFFIVLSRPSCRLVELASCVELRTGTRVPAVGQGLHRCPRFIRAALPGRSLSPSFQSLSGLLGVKIMFLRPVVVVIRKRFLLYPRLGLVVPFYPAVAPASYLWGGIVFGRWRNRGFSLLYSRVSSTFRFIHRKRGKTRCRRPLCRLHLVFFSWCDVDFEAFGGGVFCAVCT